MTRALIVLTLPLLLIACGDDEVAETGVPDGELEMRRLIPDVRSCGAREAENVVVRDPAEWARVWGLAASEMAPLPKPPAVDFGRETVLAAFLGPRDGIATISIGRVEKGGGKVVVTLVVRELAGEGRRSSPCSLVAVPRTGLPVEWRVD
jgi:hypothetical protein